MLDSKQYIRYAIPLYEHNKFYDISEYSNIIFRSPNNTAMSVLSGFFLPPRDLQIIGLITFDFTFNQEIPQRPVFRY